MMTKDKQEREMKENVVKNIMYTMIEYIELFWSLITINLIIQISRETKHH